MIQQQRIIFFTLKRIARCLQSPLDKLPTGSTHWWKFLNLLLTNFHRLCRSPCSTGNVPLRTHHSTQISKKTMKIIIIIIKKDVKKVKRTVYRTLTILSYPMHMATSFPSFSTSTNAFSEAEYNSWALSWSCLSRESSCLSKKTTSMEVSLGSTALSAISVGKRFPSSSTSLHITHRYGFIPSML